MNVQEHQSNLPDEVQQISVLSKTELGIGVATGQIKLDEGKLPELEKLKAENKKLKRLLTDLMGKADFDHDGDDILIYHDTKENGDIAYEAMKELGGIFCEKWAKNRARYEAHKKAEEKEAEFKAKKEAKKPRKE